MTLYLHSVKLCSKTQTELLIIPGCKSIAASLRRGLKENFVQVEHLSFNI